MGILSSANFLNTMGNSVHWGTKNRVNTAHFANDREEEKMLRRRPGATATLRK